MTEKRTSKYNNSKLKEKINMKTIVMGKNVTRKFDVVVRRDEDNKLCLRPFIKELIPDIEWAEICEYEDVPQSEHIFCVGDRIYISEDEKVVITERRFRADLGNWYQYTDKVLSEDEGNKESCETYLAALLKEYNKQMIEDDERAKAYCDLHKLDYEESDYDEVIKIIGENKPEMEIPKVWKFDSNFLTNAVLKIDDVVPDYVKLNI